MKYSVDTKLINGKCDDGLGFEGVIERISEHEGKYFIRWYYERSSESDRLAWYDEDWLIRFLREQGMRHEPPTPKELLDEELFTV